LDTAERGADILADQSAGRLSVYKYSLVLAVEDDGPGEGRPSASGTGLGLRNVRERLGLLFGARGRLEAGPSGPGFRVEARQPLAFTPEPVA